MELLLKTMKENINRSLMVNEKIQNKFTPDISPLAVPIFLVHNTFHVVFLKRISR